MLIAAIDTMESMIDGNEQYAILLRNVCAQQDRLAAALQYIFPGGMTLADLEAIHRARAERNGGRA